MKVNIPDINLPRVVVIGGGFAGINLAESLRKKPVQIVMFDQHNYHTFQPLLYQVATGGLEPDSIAFPLRKLFKNQRNFHFRMAEVLAANPQKKTITTSIGELNYDYLVVATGSTTNFFSIPGLEKTAQGMKSIPEALDLRSLILQNFEEALLTTEIEERESLETFVIAGGGPTGVETAGALAELKKHILPADYPELDIRRMSIHLVEAGDNLLNGMSAKASGNAKTSLGKLGVNIWLNTKVESFDGQCVRMSGDKNILTKTLIWSAGVKGNAINGFNIEKVIGGRISVNHFNQVIDEPRIFAIGDVALMESETYPKGHPMVAQVAIQQGKLLAKNILRMIHAQELTPFVYKDKGSMATIGRNKAVADIGKSTYKGRFAWLLWMLVHLFSLAGFRNRIIVFINWFWSYITYDRGTRLIIRPFIRKKTTLNTKGSETGDYKKKEELIS